MSCEACSNTTTNSYGRVIKESEPSVSVKLHDVLQTGMPAGFPWLDPSRIAPRSNHGKFAKFDPNGNKPILLSIRIQQILFSLRIGQIMEN